MAKSKPVRILYMEDDEGIARLAQKKLERAGYVILLARDGKEGLSMYAKGSCDVVLVDQLMPVHDGLEVIRTMLSQGPLPPTIMVTGAGNEEIAVEAMKLGASDYIAKDVEGGFLELLPIVIEQVLNKHRLAQEKQQALEALRESKQKIESLHETARHLETCETDEEVYQLTVDAAERILDFSICTLDIVEGNKMVVKAASSQLPPEASRESGLDEGLAGKTYRTGKTCVFGSLDEVPEARLKRADFKSGIIAPIGDIGAFQALSTEPDAFTEDDARLVELLLGHAEEALKRIHLQNELKEQAIHDPLTGVYNRNYLNQVLEQENKRSERYKHSIGFLMLDVNGFKEINDRFGHQTGDKVLRVVASLLVKAVRETDIVIRYGGDEFLIMLIETDGEAEVVKQRIVEKMTRPNAMNELLGFPVTLSIGTAYWSPDSSESLEEVLTKADRRMYEEKRRLETGDDSK